MQYGKVKFFNIEKGYGFITIENGSKDIFVHASNILDDEINKGDKVQFEPVESAKGLQATRVRLA